VGSVAIVPKCEISTGFAELPSESLRPDMGSGAVMSKDLLVSGVDSHIGDPPSGLDAQPKRSRSKKSATVAGGKVVKRRRPKATSVEINDDTVVGAVGRKVVKRRVKEGESLLSAMWGVRVIEPLLVVDSMKDDTYVISIPGERREHLIPGSCVRSHILAVNEVVRSYAQLLNVPTTSIQLYEVDLTAQFAAIRKEFSDASFREEVLADANGFSFPEEVFSRDRLAYGTTGGSLRMLVESMQSAKSYDRFNQARCDRVFRDDPEYDRLSSLATDGVIIDVPEGLVLQSEPEAPRRLQQQLDPVYRKHATKVWSKFDGIILSRDVLSVEDRDKIHCNPAHLTRKPGIQVAVEEGVEGQWDHVPEVKTGSRFLMDCSNSEAGHVLNTPEVKEKVIERYGLLCHPTIQNIVTEWYEYADVHGVLLNECRMFKDDFSGAFTQMNVNPDSAYLLAMAIGGGLLLIYLTGLFGWLGFPMAYGVLSRAFQRLFRKDLEIPLVLYVDDIIALSLAARASRDQQYIEAKCEEAMGSKAISYDKKVPPCVSCEILGWLIDLDTETLRPSPKGIRKLVFAFWMVACGDMFPLLVYQLLASLAEHYSLGLPGMRPFVYPLHSMVAQFQGNVYYKKKPSSAARLAIEVWRVVSMLSLQKNPLMCRSLHSVTKRPAKALTRMIGITDASPTGLGIALFDQNNNLIRYMGYQFPFHAIESKFQCAREYLGHMFCYFFLGWALGAAADPCEVTWINDNKAAICWADENKCNSLAAQYAFMVVTWMQLSSRFQFTEVEHFAGVLMGDIDSLSRGYSHSLDPSKEHIMTAQQLSRLEELFLLLDPSVPRDLQDHHRAFDSVIRLTRSLV
jgi:hypothetical protein